MDELLEVAPSEKRSVGKAFSAMRDARAILFEKGVLGSMISSFLILVLVFFAWVFVFSALSAFIHYFGGAAQPLLLFSIDLAFLCLYWGALFFGVMPVLLGYLRMAGLMAVGQRPTMRESFYYFTSPQRYRRSLLIGALLALGIALPVALSFISFYLSVVIYYDLLLFEFSWLVATLIFVGLLSLLSSILGGITSTGRIYFGGILATVIFMIWNIISTFLSILVILLIVRLIVLLVKKGVTPYNSAWYQIDQFLGKITYKITSIFVKKSFSYKKSLIVSLIVFALFTFVGRIVITLLINLCYAIPF